MVMHITKVPADVVFRVFTACQGDPETLILDVRPLKEFKKGHILNAYSIRLAANGKTLLDYSKNTYDRGWSDGIWWDKHVVIYGEEKLKRDHPVAAFLANDNHAKSVNVYPDGLTAFEKAYPFLVTFSVKANKQRRYPGEIAPGLLYLGDWDHANQHEILDDLKIKQIITIHNNPENLKVPNKYKHTQIPMADVDTEDISQHFNRTYEIIEEARVEKTGVLVHCGAGVSRSATLCIAYLMRKFNWPAERARAHCVQRRSIVMPNDGFWRSLCAFEAQLGIQQRSDPQATSGFLGADTPVKIAEGAAGDKVIVTFVPIKKANALEAAREAALKAKLTIPKENPSKSEPDNTVNDSNESLKRKREDDEHDGKIRSNADKASANDPSHSRSRHKDDQTDEKKDREERRDKDGTSRNRDNEKETHRSRSDRKDDRLGSEKERRHRSRSTDGDKRQRRSRSRSKDREKSARGSRDDKRDKHDKSQERPEFTEEELAVPPIVLETVKDGKAIGRLEVIMRNSLQRCTFGRLPSNEVVLEHLSISRQHAQLTIDQAGDLFITDLGSAHQTNVDGVWIRPNVAKALPVGSLFKLGGSSRGYKVVMTPQQRKKDDIKRKRDADLEEAIANANNS